MEGQKKKAISNNPPADYFAQIDVSVCFLLGALTVAVVIKPLADCGMTFWWWFPFVIFNFIYIAKGIYESPQKFDQAAYNKVASALNKRAHEIIDRVMLGDAQEALKMIKDFESFPVT